jgi:hypothetical protein
VVFLSGCFGAAAQTATADSIALGAWNRVRVETDAHHGCDVSCVLTYYMLAKWAVEQRINEKTTARPTMTRV